jgi:ribonucleoside-diphosphate reductase alpha chain
MLAVSDNALVVLRKRYLIKDEHGEPVETPAEMFRRVAHAIAAAETAHGDDASAAEERFYNLMTGSFFMPNSPTLMNAGTPVGQLAACFVIPVGDSMEEIFTALKDMAIIHQSGGGTGFSFSRLRPEGDFVKSTRGIASGPLSFMRVFDVATDIIKQGGRRRGANMGILRVDHPDIVAFIKSKKKKGALENFNISVAVTDSFMDASLKGGKIDLINPRTGLAVKSIDARKLYRLIVDTAWATGDPGLVFIDEMNRKNPTPALGDFESTNPCGEQPLLPYESCNLGSLNLAAFVDDGELDSDGLAAAVDDAVRFLDDVIDVNVFPLPQIEAITRDGNRKIGLGVMGLAEALIKLGIPYGSPESLDFASNTMSFIRDRAWAASSLLGERRGSFPNFRGSVWESRGFKAMRNATVTTIAPTGTIALIAGTSSGIEPYFALSYARQALDGAILPEYNEQFLNVAKARGFLSDDLKASVAAYGTAQNLPEVPEDVKKLFVTALDLPPEDHVRMQAAFQVYTDNAVSKTVNLPQDATPDDVDRVYRLAYKLKCKGITIYRYGSKGEQVLTLGPDFDSPEDCRAHFCPA